MASKTASAGAKVPASDITVEDPATSPASADGVAESMDLDPGIILAVRVYPDRVVAVTRDGRKIEKAVP